MGIKMRKLQGYQSWNVTIDDRAGEIFSTLVG